MPLCTLLAVRGIEKTDDAFRRELCGVAGRLGTDPNFLSATISIESGFDPKIQNKFTKATGLIQFMPSTARGLGTTVDELRAMTAVEQLLYVEKYLESFTGKLLNPGDTYLAVFFPAAIGKPRNFIIGQLGNMDFVPGTKITYDTLYKQNGGLDTNGDGIITPEDTDRAIQSRLAAAERLPKIIVDVELLPPLPPLPHRPPILIAGAAPKGTEFAILLGGAVGGWLLTDTFLRKSTRKRS